MSGRAQKGHAMLELALSAGVLTACLGGIFQFGYTFYIYNQLVSAVGDSARYASRLSMSGDMEVDKAAIRSMVVYGESKPAPGMLSVVPHLSPQQVEVEFVDDAVRVAIRGYKVDALVTTIDFDGRPAVEFPYIGPTR